MDDNTLLFSANTYLGMYIAKKYYHNYHYLWFTTAFNDRSQPKSSNPFERCQMLLKAIATGDAHDDFIRNICDKMKEGVEVKLRENIITKDDSLKIRKLIEEARNDSPMGESFMPVVVITTWEKVKEFNKELDHSEKASSSSIELLCSDVPRDRFDIVNFEQLLNNIDPFVWREI